jgi:hypothetical protein
MARETVDSRAIKAVDYDPAGQRLKIELMNGRVYRYVDVPRDIYEALMAAESKGRFYNDYIRDAFVYERLN